MPLQATSGAASYDAFGGGAAAVPQYIEDVFSTYLYAGNASTQVITNGIDLSTKGGLTWIKARDIAVSNWLFDTQRGSSNRISSNSTSGQVSASGWIDSFNANGFTLGSNGNVNGTDVGTGIPYNYASWTFRKQPKFFDVVTWTGTGANRTIAHNLGSVPGCIIVKRTDAVEAWAVYHHSLASTQYMVLNTTAAAATGATRWNSTRPTSTVFSLGTDATVNASGGTYVAYLYAHDAGGFGLTGTDNVISCGSFSSGSTANINLGWEPQWLLVKSTSSGTTGPWQIFDNMRGVLGSNDSGSKSLSANANDAEVSFSSGTNNIFITATGFSVVSPSYSGIYIAIRRGPMKVPTTGTSVFSPIARTGTSSLTSITSAGFGPDLVTSSDRTGTTGQGTSFFDRLRGPLKYLQSRNTGDELSRANSLVSYDMNGFTVGPELGGEINLNPYTYVNYLFKRAPGFFDEVCYTGTGASSQVLTHNLTVTPQLTIFKKRSASNPWDVVYNNTSYLQLNDTLQALPDTSIAATSTTITAPLGAGNGLNASGATYVAYLFATCPGVSKVGSYTGNGTTQAIACGFTGGARFVLIKRTDATGDWYVYDTARGMTVMADPYLRLNSNAAETATLGSVITSTGGFTVNAAILAAVNTNAASYIFLAIA